MVGLGRTVGAGVDLVLFGIVVTGSGEAIFPKERVLCIHQSRVMDVTGEREMEVKQNRVDEVC